ncbi:MAG: hypothetical protein HC896_15690 [Bacteroidales bacterium]|nr:hypothetical protein [Bacteroidales bacterium]
MIFCFLFATEYIYAQAIRKEWHEMTTNEKLSLMEAMHYAQSENGTYYKMGNFHGQRFNDIHFNAPAQDQFAACTDGPFLR